MRHYIIAGVVAALCSAVAYKIGYNDGHKEVVAWERSYQEYMNCRGKIRVPLVNKDCQFEGNTRQYVGGVSDCRRLCAETKQWLPCETLCHTPTPAPVKIKDGEWYYMSADCKDGSVAIRLMEKP